MLRQWQVELREKFNLNWPIYDGRKLSRYPARALRGHHEREVDPRRWHEDPVVIASSHLMRRKDRAAVLLDDAEPWDLIVLDEAHHARRRAAVLLDDAEPWDLIVLDEAHHARRRAAVLLDDAEPWDLIVLDEAHHARRRAAQEGGPNALLKLMRALKTRTQGLVLLTATPMQVHPIEVWDLLDLLGLPAEWTAAAFLDFFEQVNHPSPSAEALDRMARLFQAVERDHGPLGCDAVQRLTGLSALKAGKVLRALRDEASIPRHRLETPERRAAIAVLRAHTPIRRLISRHTRELLRRYAAAGKLSTSIADRQVEDRFIDMSEAERDLYEAVDEYISTTYKQASGAERAAVGFVMTIYRRRLASSFAALRATFEKRRDAALHGTVPAQTALEEDAPDDRGAPTRSRTVTTSPPWRHRRWHSRNVARSNACLNGSGRCHQTASSRA